MALPSAPAGEDRPSCRGWGDPAGCPRPESLSRAGRGWVGSRGPGPRATPPEEDEERHPLPRHWPETSRGRPGTRALSWRMEPLPNPFWDEAAGSPQPGPGRDGPRLRQPRRPGTGLSQRGTASALSITPTGQAADTSTTCRPAAPSAATDAKGRPSPGATGLPTPTSRGPRPGVHCTASGTSESHPQRGGQREHVVHGGPAPHACTSGPGRGGGSTCPPGGSALQRCRPRRSCAEHRQPVPGLHPPV